MGDRLSWRLSQTLGTCCSSATAWRCMRPPKEHGGGLPLCSFRGLPSWQLEWEPLDVPRVAQMHDKAQDGVLGRGTTPPRTPTAPLGGGGQAAMQWAACCPPAGAQVTGETFLILCSRSALACREGCGHRGGAGRAQMHGADAPAYCADACHVRDRPTARRARCLCAPASMLCIGCCCDVAVRCDACRCA